MTYCKRCGAELPGAANFCPACGAQVRVGEVKPSKEHRTLKVTGKPKVVVMNTAVGAIQVNHGKADEVSVDLDLRRPEDLVWNISQDDNTITITCRTRTSPLFGWPMYFFSGGPKADILVSVPAESDINVENRVGRVAVSGVKGTVVIESATGKVSVEDCEGIIKARARTGSVTLTGVNGTVSARSYTGSIRFDGALSKSENWFITRTGSIDLTLRNDADLAIEASTTLGRVTSNVDMTKTQYERGRFTGRIGAGTGRLVAETKTGNIRIHQ
jgi:hypothetical protein